MSAKRKLSKEWELSIGKKKKAKIILTGALTSEHVTAIDILFEQICYIYLSAVNGLADFY